MDGNKKISILYISVFFVIIIAACNVQNPGYVGLYVDDIITENDSNTIKTEAPYLYDKNLLITSSPDNNTFTNTYIDSSSNTVKHLFFEEDINQTDSLKSQSTKADSAHLKVEQSNIFKSNYKRELDSTDTTSQLPKDFLTGSPATNKITSSQIGGQPQSALISQSDTVSITKNDSINQLQKQQGEQQKTIYKTDTVFIVRDFPGTQGKVGKSESNEAIERELLAINETIRQLRNELNSQPKIVKTDTIYVNKDLSKVKSNEDSISQEKVSTNIFQVKNNSGIDSTNQQQNFLLSGQGQISNIDSLKIQKDAPDSTVMENSDSPNMIINSESLMKSDSANQLQNKNYLNSKNQTDTVFITNDLPSPKYAAVDTILITAHYNMGKVEPDNDVLNEIDNISKNRSIRKIVLSGHTDISGSKKINKQLTDARLNYIFSQISSLVPIENIYLQNFGDTFASPNVVKNERRVEINLIVNTEEK